MSPTQKAVKPILDMVGNVDCKSEFQREDWREVGKIMKESDRKIAWELVRKAILTINPDAGV